MCRLASGACPEPDPSSPDNAVWALNAAEETLHNNSAELQRARMLRFLVHIAGDVHQPLHAADYFSSQFPTGDLGGNKWNINVPAPFPFYSTNLHSYWDQALGLWTQNLRRPLNATGKAWVAAISAQVRAKYPAASLKPELAENNVTNWALESHALAEEFVCACRAHAPRAPEKKRAPTRRRARLALTLPTRPPPPSSHQQTPRRSAQRRSPQRTRNRARR